jgi:hypothetical protein
MLKSDIFWPIVAFRHRQKWVGSYPSPLAVLLAIPCNSSTSSRAFAKPQLLYITTVSRKDAPVDPIEIEDTDDWLGCPTPLETCRHQLRIYENEVEELTLQLRQAREKIFKLVEMHAEAIGQRDEAMANLRARSGESAALRKQLYDLDISARVHQREVERLRGILDGLVDPPKTSEQTT